MRGYPGLSCGPDEITRVRIRRRQEGQNQRDGIMKGSADHNCL